MSQEEKRYRAFISYSHGDEGWARWLQHALERYRVPAKLRRERPGLPGRLHPVFRDREELASSGDLTDSIRTAMGASEALVVVCSPAAARSKWVNEEIRLFRTLGGADRIFCLLVDGTPDGDAGTGAFPRALLIDDSSQPLPEPLAADVTEGGDGKRGALVKIAAGLLGVGIDDLRQRDQQRQVRFWSSVAIGAMAISVITIGLAIYAYLARAESELRRTQAENLIGFMLGDLRERLQPVGRLDVLDAVGDEAMAYFAALGDRGTEDEVMARAMALRQIGEVRFNQGQLEPALEAFTESRNVARDLHQAYPEDNDIFFELGQAEFWVGYVAWQRSDLDGANAAFQAYRDVAVALAERAPDNPDYRLELMYSWSNLGSLARERGDPEAALQSFQRVVAINESLLAEAPGDADLQYELTESLSWLGSAQRDTGLLIDSLETFTRSRTLARDLHRSIDDKRHTYSYAALSSLQAEGQMYLGQTKGASEAYREAIDLAASLVALDPDNARWRDIYWRARSRLGEWFLVTDALGEAQQHLAASSDGLQRLSLDDPSNQLTRQRVALIEAKLALSEGRAGQVEAAGARVRAARLTSDRALQESEATLKQTQEAAQVRLAQGDIAIMADDAGSAVTSWREALDLLQRFDSEDPVAMAIEATLLDRLGRTEDAEPLWNRLGQMGFRDPRYTVSNAAPEKPLPYPGFISPSADPADPTPKERS